MKKIVYLFIIAILVSGCVTTIPKERLNVLTIGLNKDDVRTKVGKPTGIWNVYSQSQEKENGKRNKIPLEIWEYYISEENKSTLLYIYKGQVKQIEYLNRHALEFGKNFKVSYEIPKVKFEIDANDIQFEKSTTGISDSRQYNE